MKKSLSFGLGLFVLGSLLVSQDVFAATLFGSDSFETDLKWDNVNISNSSGINRDDIDGTFTVGATGKGLLFKGSSSPNPDDASERIISTLGNANLVVNYSISTQNFSGSDEFLVQYSLDDGSFVTAKTYTSINAPFLHTADTFNISNPNHKTKLVVRFVLNADSSNDKVGIDNVEITGDTTPNYYDGFETGFTGWTVVGASITSNAVSVNSNASNINIWTAQGNNTDGQSANIDSTDSITKTFSTVGLQDINVSYARKVNSLEAGEDFKTEYTINGVDWINLETLNGLTGNTDDVSFSPQTFMLPDTTDNNSSFGLRFSITGSDGNDDAYVDDVVVWGDILVVKTDPNLSVDNSPVTYNGFAQSATVNGDVAGTVSDVKYNNSSTIPTDVGTYAITADFVPTDTVNYNNLDDASAGSFVINKADVIITVTPYTVTYDGSSHTATGTATGVLGEDLSANLDLSNTTHTNANSYSDAWTFTGGQNYNDDNGTTDDNIDKANATIEVNGYEGIYDGNSYGANGTATGILGESLDGLNLGSSYANVPGGNADWTFTDSTGNYNDSSGSAIITITTRDITVTADTKGKDFGDSDPALTYTVTNGSVIEGDSFSGNLTREAGEDVGTYAITQGDLALNFNYNLTYEGADLTIAPNTITVTTDPQTKVYGTSDPELTYQFTPALEEGDEFSGSLTRTEGENVGSYGISQGGLSLDSNYNLSFTGSTLDITLKSITVTADPQSKVYGDTDPGLTYTVNEGGLVGEDILSGSLTRDEGENVGSYDINQGSLGNDNYDISYQGASFEITIANQTITFEELSNKTVGDPDFELDASSDSDSEIPITFSENGEGSVCTISEENIVHLTGTVGTCTITAHQGSNDNYNAAEDVTRSFTVSLNDITPPVITLTGSSTVTLIIEDTYIDAGATALDNIDGNITESITTVNTVNTGSAGNYTVTYNVSDEAGNAAVPVVRNVLVKRRGNISGSVAVGQTLGASTGPNEQVLGAEKFVFTKNMKRGSTGDEVTELQKFLNAAGYGPLSVDGKFGKLTRDAVKAFQVANPPLKVDGRVGPLTRAVLNK